MKLNPHRVVVGMSGGVDSSVAAALLVEQGYEVIGITIKTYRYEDVGGNVGNDSSCCSLDGINDARRVALQLGIPHYVVDFSERFKKNVIDYFVSAYLSGVTPNPCVQCNRSIKWGEMENKADALGAQWIATGHYAQLERTKDGRFYISRGKDSHKDQSYALWNVKQESLARTIFPLAGFTKERARAEAARLGLSIASKPESFEICFIPDNDYSRFLRDTVPNVHKEGNIILDGKSIGKHEGYANFTIGQRRGLGISSTEPLYVLNIKPEENIVEVGNKNKLFHQGLIAADINLMKHDLWEGEKRLLAKIRYKDEGAMSTCRFISTDKIEIVFDEPRRAITPGQSVVLYEDDDVVAGGIIQSVIM